MTLIQDELEIINLDKLLTLNLVIPDYQRPYRWSSSSTNTLFEDTYQAFKANVGEYRLGSVILHKARKPENIRYVYNLVDGQQRATTLSILLYVLGQNSQLLLKQVYQASSQNAIVDNFELLIKRVQELPPKERELYKNYLKGCCTVVKIVTDSEQEAFQFFDSQNSRGKALKPQDLLKAYHLREMRHEPEQEKVQLITEWENTDQNALEDLFKYYLYPVIQWARNKDGLYYSVDKIQYFKGIKSSNTYNYATYHKASNMMIEQVNLSNASELLGSGLNQFQLVQPIIAGRRFFVWTLYYATLLNRVKNKIENYHQPEQISNLGTGNIYIKRLYEGILLLFADRFGFETIDDLVMCQLYTWCYSLRLGMKMVRLQTINNYAQGRCHKINVGCALFAEINEMVDPQYLKAITLDRIEEVDVQSTGNESMYKFMKKWNRW